MVAAAPFVSGSRLLTWSEPARTAIRLTWWETTSCISRASCARSLASTDWAVSRRSCSRAREISTSRSDSSRLAWTSWPRKTGAAAVPSA